MFSIAQNRKKYFFFFDFLREFPNVNVRASTAKSCLKKAKRSVV